MTARSIVLPVRYVASNERQDMSSMLNVESSMFSVECSVLNVQCSVCFMFTTMAEEHVLAVRYHEHGKPKEVLVLDEVCVASPGKGEVLFELLAATVNPSDLGMIMGSYGRLKELPAVAGREGVGKVIALGDGVDSLQVGDQVQMPEHIGVWRQKGIAQAADLLRVPSFLTPEQGATAFVNPATAVRLLSDFGELQSGDWLIQNAANSAVGFSVIGYAKHKGFRTINVVRNQQWEADLKAAGADVVVIEGSDYPKHLQDLTGGALPKLGLNSVGGNSVSDIIKSMGEGGTVVTFGGMVGDKIRFPTRQLIFSDLTLQGYWMDKWNRRQSREAITAFYGEVFDLIGRGVMQVPVEKTYPFSDALAAVKQGFAAGRKGKVLIVNE